MAAQQNVILITGGNGGIGFQTAKELLEDGKNTVIIGSRSRGKGDEAVKKLKSHNLSGKIELIQLDVTDPSSVEAAAKKVGAEHGRVDVLVNNAGVASFSDGDTLDEITETMNKTFATNTTGTVIVVTAFASLLKKSPNGARIINVSSISGSITKRLDPTEPTYVQVGYSYQASKAALNMVSATQHVIFGPQGMKVFTICPGFTVSNLSTFNTSTSGAKPTSEGARPIVETARGQRDHLAGKFFHDDGEYPW